jgi:DNA-binding winged helix-turn-helix (wHTH) protein
MGQQDNLSYEFGRFRLNVAERVLLRDEDVVPLTPKVFDILLLLVENSGQVVSKDELMKRVWPNTFVEEGNLTQNISLLRKALGESPGGVQFIETVPRRGYRFVADMLIAPKFRPLLR